MDVPISEPLIGRRIYIHEYSLAQLAQSDPRSRRPIRQLMYESWNFRITAHCVESDALIGLISRSELDQVLAALRLDYDRSCAPILRNLAYLTPRGAQSELVLQAGESLFATCFDSGYYTFATDSGSACRMYDDHAPLRNLYSQCVLGAGDQDLTMIRGKRLIWRQSRAPNPEPDVELPDLLSAELIEVVSRARVVADRKATDRTRFLDAPRQEPDLL